MGKFAVIDGEDVINTIIADSLEIAEQVSGKTCVEYDTESAEPGGKYIDSTFIARKPYQSWTLINKTWQAPISYPIVDPEDPKEYVWDENTISWIERV